MRVPASLNNTPAQPCGDTRGGTARIRGLIIPLFFFKKKILTASSLLIRSPSPSCLFCSLLILFVSGIWSVFHDKLCWVALMELPMTLAYTLRRGHQLRAASSAVWQISLENTDTSCTPSGSFLNTKDVRRGRVCLQHFDPLSQGDGFCRSASNCETPAQAPSQLTSCGQCDAQRFSPGSLFLSIMGSICQVE